MTAEGDARALHHERDAVLAHAPGRGGGGIAADPALAAEDTVTATSRAPNTSKYRKTAYTVHTMPTQYVTTKKRIQHICHECSFFIFDNITQQSNFTLTGDSSDILGLFWQKL